MSQTNKAHFAGSAWTTCLNENVEKNDESFLI